MATQFEKKGRRILGVSKQGAIRLFFSANAMVSIFVLGAICAFLLREAALFFPQHHEDLESYRLTGQEYAGYIIDEMDEYTKLKSLTNQAYYQELNETYGVQRGLSDSFGAFTGIIFDAGDDLVDELADARDAVEDAEGEKKAQAEAQLADVEQRWDEFLRAEIAQADREVVDSFGRLGDNDWLQLKNAMLEWDPVIDEPPALVADARAKSAEGMKEFETARTLIGQAGSELAQLRGELIRITTEIKNDSQADQSAAARKEALLEGSANAKTAEDRARLRARAEEITVRESFPYSERIHVLDGSRQKHKDAVAAMKEDLAEAVPLLPENLESKAAEELTDRVRSKHPRLVSYLEESLAESEDWRYDEPLSYVSSLSAFFFGKNWTTNSSFHDFYGLLPLFSGSFLIAIIALIVAIPFSLGAAIYVNRLAGPAQQNVIKPIIELIEAIPSVVLGFFGIMVLGESLRELSQVEALSWIPGFPMQERLNILNAGLLLALMAVPTMFTLCEDAINNVPSSFTEASLALGGSKLQTVLKIVVPTAFSGILAAILLGFGRVIGETMVVLLVAGNQIAIPDFSLGFGVITQPAHTMTGIIAQEMGEVTADTIHYRALFSVGLVLFTISLIINIGARRIIKSFGHAT